MSTASVRVPASTSNLGSGFDCVGLAVDRWLSASVQVIYDGSGTAEVKRSGTLSRVDVAAEKDLLYKGFVSAVAFAKSECRGHVKITAHSDIPVGRGLGSSAAALVAGALLANEALSLGLGDDKIVDICSEIEGHPDNAAAAVHGGAVLGVPQPGASFKVTQLPVHSSLRFVFAIPNFVTETKKARSVLPSVLPYSKAVLAVARGASLIKGLETGDAEHIAIGLDDVLHVPYRRSLIKGYDEVTTAAVEAGAIGATLSGSGSTLVAIATESNAQKVGAAMQQAWQSLDIESEVFVSSGSSAGYSLKPELATV